MPPSIHEIHQLVAILVAYLLYQPPQKHQEATRSLHLERVSLNLQTRLHHTSRSGRPTTVISTKMIW